MKNLATSGARFRANVILLDKTDAFKGSFHEQGLEKFHRECIVDQKCRGSFNEVGLCHHHLVVSDRANAILLDNSDVLERLFLRTGSLKNFHGKHIVNQKYKGSFIEVGLYDGRKNIPKSDSK